MGESIRLGFPNDVEGFPFPLRVRDGLEEELSGRHDGDIGRYEVFLCAVLDRALRLCGVGVMDHKDGPKPL